MASDPTPSWWGYAGVVYVAWRISMANRMPIMDCDEVYNYWEPLHFLHHGTGMQTWEYASQYALRTYAYLVPMLGVSRIYEYLYSVLPSNTVNLVSQLLVSHPILSPKVWTFCCLRSTLGGIMACSELLFCRALAKKLPQVAEVTCLLLVTSAGMCHAAPAYLPSSTVLMLFMCAVACWWNGNHVGTMACAVVASLSVGWPFGAVLFVPMGLHVLHHHIAERTFSRFLGITILWTCIVQGIVMVVDRHYYGRWVSPVYNIFVYNTKGGGDELYGVEPTSYYIKNLLLNFNYVALLALPSPLLVLLWRKKDGNSDLKTSLMVTFAPLILWLAIVVPRPHKEERFLFPVYPLLCLGAAVTISCTWDIVSGTKKSVLKLPKLAWCILLCVPCCLLALSRTAALSRYYTAPLAVYAELQQHAQEEESALVCTCGEWYRFPSSYYLPPSHELAFLPSSFGGQLPHPFTEFGSKPESLALGGVFNDQNLEEADRYVKSIEDCSFVVELSVTSAEERKQEECLEFMQQGSSTWDKVAEFPYLDASRTSFLHRVLYLPFLHERSVETGAVQYNSYALYKKN